MALRASLAAGVGIARLYAGNHVRLQMGGIVDREFGMADLVAIFCGQRRDAFELWNLIAHELDFALQRAQQVRAAPRHFEDADGARFVRRGKDETAVFLYELLRRLAHFATEDDIELVKLPGEIRHRDLIGEDEEHHEIGPILELREQSSECHIHFLHRQPFAEIFSKAAAIDDADDSDAPESALNDFAGIEKRRAGGLIEEVGAEHGHGRTGFQFRGVPPRSSWPRAGRR